MTVYQDSDAHAGLYNYAKALEAAEAGLLDYFYQHFRLAGEFCVSLDISMTCSPLAQQE